MSSLILLVCLVACAASVLPANGQTPQFGTETTLPEGFAYEPIVSELDAPIDMAVLPSGDILLIEKGFGADASTAAAIKLLHEPDGIAVIEPLMTLEMNAAGDSGLLSILLDPNFADNKHFYIWHSTAGEAFEWQLGGEAKYRLSRFTLDTATRTIDPAS